MLVSKEERRRTDVFAIYICIGFVAILFGLVGYAFFNGTIYRTINGIDDCGNICGRDNPGLTIDTCGSHDKREFPLTLVNYTQSPYNPNITYSNAECVKNCSVYPGYYELANRCLKSGQNGTDSETENDPFLQEVFQDLSNTWYHIILTCIIAMVFSYMLLILFRYAIKYVIWIIYIGLVVLFVIAGVAFLIFYAATDKKEEGVGLIVVAVVFFVIALVLGVLLCFFRDRIKLIIQLFKEASKALIDVPTIIAEPILTFIALFLTAVGFVYFAMVVYSSGKLQEFEKEDKSFYKAEYKQDAAMVLANFFNLVAFLWFVSFIFGCQNFVIAGTITQWYFSRNKTKLDSPVSRAFKYLLQFHIGSICLGSIVLTIVKVIRMIAEGIKNSLRETSNPGARIAAECCKCIMELIEEFLTYLARNAFIIVALDGTNLFKSGKKAFHLLKNHIIDVIALNKFGDFVLFLGKVFVVLISGFVCYELVGRNEAIKHAWIPVLISCIFAYLIVDCFMTVYEMTIDTIFLCFCEDCEINDGETNPYYMSPKLMNAMREMKSAAGGDFNFGGPNQNIEAGTRPLNPPPHIGFTN